MRTLKSFEVVTIIFVMLLSLQAEGKRPSPPQVAPVVSEGVMYKATYDLGVSGKRNYIIEIWNEKGETKVREVIVYTVQFKKGLEADVQNDFIARMQRDGNDLIVTSERGNKFSVNLSTYVVKKIGASS